MSITDGTDADAVRRISRELRTLRHTHADIWPGAELVGVKRSEDYLNAYADALDAEAQRSVFA